MMINTKRAKRIFAYILSVVFALVMFSGCAESENKNKNEKVKIVTTLFPQYDFARTIASNKADVILLLKPGVSSHSYEPTSADMLEIANADMFVYTGKDMEVWADTVLKSVENDSLKVVDVSKGTKVDFVQHNEHGTQDEHSENESVYDPHIWTNPQNAKIIVANILDALKEIDEANSEYYEKNATSLLKELDTLDNDFETFFNSCENKTIVFGGKFAMHYFAQRYGLNCIAAYDTCSGEGEASPGKIAYICDVIRNENLKAVYYEELTDPAVANTIAQETNTTPLLLHSCHNVSENDFNSGETYISLMRKNLENLKEGMK